MKKKLKSKPVAPPFDQIQQARAEKTIANVREHYERGRRANREEDDFRPRELAERHRISPHTLRKERRFARRYSEDELQEFLSLRRADGMPLHWGHVIYLITLNRKQDRQRLQKKAAREGWSAPELQAAIQREIRPDAGPGGRPVKVPETAEGKLRLMIEETDRWLKRYEAVFEGNGEQESEDFSDGSLDELRGSLAEKLKIMSQAKGKITRRLNRAGW